MDTCEYCNEPINGNYCSNCGQPTHLKRIDRQYIFHEIREVLGANKGLLFTIKKVFISPGTSVQQFLTKERHRFVKPIVFVILTSLIYALINLIFNSQISDNLFVSPIFGIVIEDSDGMKNVFKLLKGSLAYSNLLTGLFMAFWLKLFFKKAGYNIFEIFILLCFVIGVSTLLISIGTIIQSVTPLAEKINLNSIMGFIYFVWAVGQFFNRKKVASYLKTFFAYILGGITFVTIIIIVGIIIELIMKLFVTQ
jgi:hypothetical protein